MSFQMCSLQCITQHFLFAFRMCSVWCKRDSGYTEYFPHVRILPACPNTSRMSERFPHVRTLPACPNASVWFPNGLLFLSECFSRHAVSTKNEPTSLITLNARFRLTMTSDRTPNAWRTRLPGTFQTHGICVYCKEDKHVRAS